MAFRKSRLIAATAMGLALSVTAANAATVDLGFILDESGSVGKTNYESSVIALRNALNQIPLASATVTYRVGVVSFGASADTIAAPVIFDTQTNKNTVLAALLDESSTTDGGTRGYGTPSGITNATNYGAALNLLNSEFGTLGDTSIINMATDGGNNSGYSNTEVAGIAGALRSDGWDALNFEAVANTSASNRNYLASIGFDTASFGGCGQITDASGITNVADNCFVLKVDTFDKFESAILKKVNKTVIDTGGDPTSPIPLPAGLPLILSGIGALGGLGALRRRKSKA